MKEITYNHETLKNLAELHSKLREYAYPGLYVLINSGDGCPNKNGLLETLKHYNESYLKEIIAGLSSQNLDSEEQFTLDNLKKLSSDLERACTKVSKTDSSNKEEIQRQGLNILRRIIRRTSVMTKDTELLNYQKEFQLTKNT